MSLVERDKAIIWHPYTDEKLYGTPIPIISAKETYLFDEHGKKYIDAISSWWTNIHGHSHPHIAQKVAEQVKKLDHVIFSGFTHEPAVLLAEKLLHRLPSGQKKIFYSDNGSTAVEVALKMAFQYWYNKGQKRTKVLAFKNGYHGDTFGAMAVSGRSAFTKPFNDLLFEVVFIDIPTSVLGLDGFRFQVSGLKEQVASFIFEPLVQGTAGMVIYEPDVLNEMLAVCKDNNIITIADEVMTGFGRTGKFFATDHLSNKPDIFCLSKGLTGGTMAMGVTSCTQQLFDVFQGGDNSRSLFHGHSYTANPIACSAALASLEVFEQNDVFADITRITEQHKKFVLKIDANKKVKQVRSRGTILAIELNSGEETSYFNTIRLEAYNFFISKGILMRPLGNIIYVMPPYCISNDDLNYIYDSIQEFLETL
ncbi:MAG: adenosylmethionine--8-amino-7-oxononanoate transaminase [Bacteroidetes bacterium]|nr:adenosylmethionine--8-amino-7-oxononanoate transaminase [Bacteroidota bacterium]